MWSLLESIPFNGLLGADSMVVLFTVLFVYVKVTCHRTNRSRKHEVTLGPSNKKKRVGAGDCDASSALKTGVCVCVCACACTLKCRLVQK